MPGGVFHHACGRSHAVWRTKYLTRGSVWAALRKQRPFPTRSPIAPSAAGWAWTRVATPGDETAVRCWREAGTISLPSPV